jgi:putative membrane protein insertion efficiency factor
VTRWLRVVGAPARGMVLGLLRGYRALIGPLLGQRCRFYPSCSAYAMEAVHRHGAAKGLVLAAWRLVRCSPLSAGGPDPVPERGMWRSVGAGAGPEYDGVIRGS